MHSIARKLDLYIANSSIVCDSLYKDWEAYTVINTTTVPKTMINTKFYIEAAKNVSLFNNKVRMCGLTSQGGVFLLT
jgi:hypothetical protein